MANSETEVRLLLEFDSVMGRLGGNPLEGS